ncbi:Arm DNA-binding domain-containing protein [Lysinibacillus fusiformis]|uniref:Arm DNA-binding domain-containing protein n=1 Tax=Lysinibacillus fusiformis TaxID=28031 RepID=UPI003D02546E
MAKSVLLKFYLGTDSLTGKPLTTTRRGFKSRKEAQDARKQLQLELYSGTYKKQQYEMYQDIYNMWVEQYENSVEESTFVKLSVSLKITFYLLWVLIS